MGDSRVDVARLAWAGILMMGAANATGQALPNPFERGPNPTSSLLNASAGHTGYRQCGRRGESELITGLSGQPGDAIDFGIE